MNSTDLQPEQTGEPRLATLQECALLLDKDETVQAPKLITLKRWSASGQLDSAKVIPSGSSRPKFNYAEVLIVARRNQKALKTRSSPTGRSAHVLQRDQREPLSPAFQRRIEPLQAPHTSNAPLHLDELSVVGDVDMNALARAVAAQMKPLVTESLEAVQQQMLNGLANLDAVRKMMMLRYDTELHSTKERLAALTAENATLKEAVMDAARLNMQLRKINEKLDNMALDLPGTVK